MPHTLIRHPDSAPSVAGSVEVSLAWQARDRLWLRYHAEVPPGELVMPEPFEDPERRDNLWRSTCFELFLREPGERRYFEFNFSTSRHWAAYRFEDVRSGRSDLTLVEPPEISLDPSANCALEVRLTPPPELAGGPLDVALSAVMQEQAGGIGYWALAHPPGRPDFHHPDGFVAALPAPSDG